MKTDEKGPDGLDPVMIMGQRRNTETHVLYVTLCFMAVISCPNFRKSETYSKGTKDGNESNFKSPS